MLLSQILTSKFSARNVPFNVLGCHVTVKHLVTHLIIYQYWWNSLVQKYLMISNKKLDVSDIPVSCELHEPCGPHPPCEPYELYVPHEPHEPCKVNTTNERLSPDAQYTTYESHILNALYEPLSPCETNFNTSTLWHWLCCLHWRKAGVILYGIVLTVV